MKRNASLAALALAALLAACSSSSDGIGSHDAGSDQASIHRDTGPSLDTPPTPDTKPALDVSLDTDNTLLDGGLPIDTTSATVPTLITVVLDAARASVAVGATLPITATAFYSDSSSTEVVAVVTVIAVSLRSAAVTVM